MEENLLKTIINYNLINSGDSIVIGVSGGPDSICLLHILNKLKAKLHFNIFVAHINHMIRPEADEETKYVKDFCKSLGIECFVKKANILELSKQDKKGTEEKGRQIRYEFFEEILNKTSSNKIATAHNANDNAETVLMNILRGCGTSGLKGIEPLRDYKFIRPLIETSRKDIENYCIENNLNPKYDQSNKENIYTRNKIRNILIPFLEKEFNPNAIEVLNNLSKIAKEEDSYLLEIIKQKYENIFISKNKHEIVLDLKKFNNENLVIKKKLILYTIKEVLGSSQNIESKNITDIIKLCQNNIGNKFLIPNKKIKILIKNKKIFFINNS